MHESQEFNALFKRINYLKGGVASGFNHVEKGACGTMLKDPPWYRVAVLFALTAASCLASIVHAYRTPENTHLSPMGN